MEMRFELFLDGSGGDGFGSELLVLHEDCNGHEQCDSDDDANHTNHPKV